MNGLVLVGFMGTGKNAVGKALATRLQCSLLDTDNLVVTRAGKPIPRIFQEEGEPVFRAWETQVLEELAAQADELRVVATGGGIVLAEANWKYLRTIGDVVCLTARPETILERVGTAADRPLLAGSKADVLERIQTLLQAREAAYAQADWLCPTDELTPQAVADQIHTWWAKRKQERIK